MTKYGRASIIDEPKPVGGGRKGALHKRQAVSPPSQGEPFPRKGGCFMVTYSELFAYSLVLIGIVGLSFQIFSKRK